MRKVKVYYRDIIDHYETEYETGPYPGNYAEDVKRNLSLMGAKDFRVEPYEDKKAA